MNFIKQLFCFHTRAKRFAGICRDNGGNVQCTCGKVL